MKIKEKSKNCGEPDVVLQLKLLKSTKELKSFPGRGQIKVKLLT